MNHIQTAGQQKYYDFVAERAKSIRTGMIVWMSLLCLALISLFNNIVIAVIMAVIGITLAVTNLKAQKELKEKLNNISDQEEFFRQLADSELVQAEEGHILVTKDYALVFHTDIMIYELKEMEKVEVGMKGNVQKYLFLTDKSRKRHEIMSCMKNGGDSEEFDKIYYALTKRVGV